MGTNSNIEWTDHTFNPWIGCTKVSPGCAHCYAETLDRNRYSKTLGGGTKAAPVSHWGAGAPRHRTSEANWKQPLKWDRESAKNPFQRSKVFCASLADWLDEEVPLYWVSDLLGLIRSTPNLDWLLLTKRPQNWRMRMEEVTELDGDSLAWSWLRGNAPANVWIGTTVEDQQRADERVPELLRIPARVRFLSCEPLLGPVESLFDVDGKIAQSMGSRSLLWPADCINWVICGGESGAGARPMHPDWARSLRDQCSAASVAFFFKQWGEWYPLQEKCEAGVEVSDFTVEGRSKACAMVGDCAMGRCGKSAAGRLLHGREHNEFPRA